MKISGDICGEIFAITTVCPGSANNFFFYFAPYCNGSVVRSSNRCHARTPAERAYLLLLPRDGPFVAVHCARTPRGDRRQKDRAAIFSRTYEIISISLKTKTTVLL